ncbi:MAG: fibronectin type III domain-containing protein, partial [Candidatus Aenigmarchaeota archaeon]|nr:fibronectin type III domain-containing protein [Candidatus Aenigmarchaeota archaeon]
MKISCLLALFVFLSNFVIFISPAFGSCEGPGEFYTHYDYSCNYPDGYSYGNWCCDHDSPYGKWWKYCTNGAADGKCLEPSTAPAAPTNPSPTNGAAGVSTSPTLSWSHTVASGGWYHLYYKKSTDVSWSYVANLATNSHTLSGLDLETTYEWNVRACNPGVTCTDSATWSFTTDTPPTWSVSLSVSQTNVVVDTSVTLTATANQDVGSTPYFIRIYEGTTRVKSCSTGTTCSAIISSSTATTKTYVAKVENYDGSDVKTTSTSVSVTWVGVPTCQISLVDKSVPSSIRVGDNLNIWIKLRMIFQDYDPYATTTVYVEIIDDDSQTKIFNFPYSSSTDEKTFTFYTGGWQSGSYNVYVDAIGENNCGSLPKTYIGNVIVNPAIAPCSISASVSTPSNVYIGDRVYTTITLTNSGDVGGYTDVTAYLCRDDPYCELMTCDGIDPRVYVGAKSSSTLTCWKTAMQQGYHRIKVVYTTCSVDGVDPITYSGRFFVSPRIPACQITINKIILERGGVDPDIFCLG